MSQAPRNTDPSANIPQITALSTAFPMAFESPTPAPTDPRRTSANQPDTPRPPHRHDAGK